MLFDNSKKITPYALNIGIKYAKGGIIVRVDAHTILEKIYISKCIRNMKEYKLDNIGGIWKIVPRDETVIGKVIVLSLSCLFGVGNSVFRTGAKEPRWVDTAY